MIEKCLAYSPDKRCTAKQALKHHYFADLYQQDRQTYANYKKAARSGGSRSSSIISDRDNHDENDKLSRNSSQSNIQPNNNINSSQNYG